MAYVAPVPSDLQERFPAFTQVASSVLAGALAEAARMVDESWTEGDFATARLLLAAHILTMDGVGTHAEARAVTGGQVKRQKAEGSEIEFATSGVTGAQPATVNSSMLATTSFGRRFLALLAANQGGVMAVRPCAALPASHLSMDWP